MKKLLHVPLLIFFLVCAMTASAVSLVPRQQYGLGKIQAIAYSPLGNNFLTAGSGGVAYLWDLSTRQIVRKFSGHTLAIDALAYSSDGSKFLSGSEDARAILWNANTGARIHTLSAHTGSVLAVAFSPNGTRILTGSADHTSKLWDAASGAVLFTLTGHTAAVTSVAVSPDGTRLLTGSNDGTARLWNAATGALIRTFSVAMPPPADFQMKRVAFLPDGVTIMTVETRGVVKLWSTATGTLLRTLYRGHFHVTACEDVTLSPDGTKLIFSGSYNEDGDSSLVDLASETELIWLHGSQIHLTAALSADSRKALIADEYDDLMFFDLTTTDTFSSVYTLIYGHSNSVHSLTLTPTGTHLITGNGNDSRTWGGKCKMYDLNTGEFVRHFQNQKFNAGITYAGVVFTPGGLLIGVAKGTIASSVWDPATGNLLHADPYEGANYLVYSPDGRWRSSAGKVYGPKYHSFAGLDAWSSAFSRDSTRMILGETGRFMIWNIANDTTLTVNTGGVNKNLGVAFSPDGSKVLTGNEDKTAKLWQISGALIRTFSGHTGAVTSVDYSPDGRWILTGSRDRTARLWDAATGIQLGAVVNLTGEISVVKFMPDGANFLAGSLDGIVKMWRIMPTNQAGRSWSEYE